MVLTARITKSGLQLTVKLQFGQQRDDSCPKISLDPHKAVLQEVLQQFAEVVPTFASETRHVGLEMLLGLTAGSGSSRIVVQG